MGYLTTITIYNDGLHGLKDNAESFAQQVESSAGSLGHSFPANISLGNFCNFGKVHRPRHADSHTVYVHAGNTVCEMNPHSEETKRLMRDNPKFFEKLMTELWNTHKELCRAQEDLP